MFTIRRIGDDKPPFSTFGRFNRTGVALMKDDAAVVKESAESCPTAVFFRFFDDDCGNITCANENFGGTILCRPGVFLHFLPERHVKALKALKSKAAHQTRGGIGCHGCGFNGNGARSAEWINQGQFRFPAGKRQQRGGEVFLQRGFAVLEAPAALKEGFACEINVKAHMIKGEVGLNAYIRRTLFY